MYHLIYLKFEYFDSEIVYTLKTTTSRFLGYENLLFLE